MKIDYDKYLNRLQAKRAESPYYQAFQKQQANISLTQRSMDQQMRARLSSNGSSAGAVEQAHQNLQESAAGQTQSIWGEMAASESQRRDMIDEKIEGIRMAKEQQEEAERQAKQDRKNGLIKAGLQVGGAALGSVLIPGVGGMVGAQIGAGLGGMAGGFVGGDGKMAANYANPQEIMTGFTDAAGALAGSLTLKNQKLQMNNLVNAIQGKQLSTQQIGLLQSFIGQGDIEAAIKFLEGIK